MKEKTYEVHTFYNCIDDFEVPDGDWKSCPNCVLKPKVWVFDNGRSTVCGCWNDTYDHFSIHAESIMSKHKRANGSNSVFSELMHNHQSELRHNWNEWCVTGTVTFQHASERQDGKW